MKKRIGWEPSMYFLMIGEIVLSMVVFAIIIVIYGYNRFTVSFTEEYNYSVLRTAKTAMTMVNADHIDEYLEENGASDEYKETKEKLTVLCNTQDMSVVYVVKPDADYKNVTSVFNCLNYNSTYSPWEIGHRSENADEDYEVAYRKMYEEDLKEATIDRIDNLGEGLPHVTGLVPIRNSEGKVVAIMCAQRFVEELSDTRWAYVKNVGLVTLVLMLISIAISSIYLRRHIVEPINDVRSEAERFANENTESGKLKESTVSKVKEIVSLANSIDKMEGDMLNYIDNLTTVTMEKQRIDTELLLASSIQQSALITDFSPFSERDDFDIYALMVPAKEVGGDFYDIFMVDDNHLAMVMADVSGKGVPAALFMMVCKIILSEYATNDKTPAEIIDYVNNRICEKNSMKMFVTVWLGIIELSTGKVIACNAGHEDPAIYRKGDKFELYKTKHNLMVGVKKNINYTNYEFTLSHGDKLFLYTDGVPEATNQDEKMFGLEAMVNSLSNSKDKSITELLESVKNDVDGFVGDAVQFDDITMMCVEYK